MRNARFALAAGLLVTAIAVALVLSRSPQVLLSKNPSGPTTTLTSVPGTGGACQPDQAVPAHTSAIRLSLGATAGPRVAVNVYSGKALVTHGESAPGWVGYNVTVPVKALDHAVPNATVCFAFKGANERVEFLGVHSPKRTVATSGTAVIPGQVVIEYTRPGSSSWWSIAKSVARHMGLGRAWAGTWIPLLVLILMATAIGLGSWLTIRESR